MFEISKVNVPKPCIFPWIPASIPEAATVIPNGAKIFFADGTAAFINGPTILLNNEHKKVTRLNYKVTPAWFSTTDFSLFNC